MRPRIGSLRPFMFCHIWPGLLGGVNTTYPLGVLEHRLPEPVRQPFASRCLFYFVSLLFIDSKLQNQTALYAAIQFRATAFWLFVLFRHTIYLIWFRFLSYI